MGIDCGTSAVRVCAIDEHHEIRGLTHSKLTTQSPHAWQQAVTSAFTELLTLVPAQSVQAIAVDGTSGTVLLCDTNGNPLSPAIMYDDASHARQLAGLDKSLAPAAYAATAGLPKILHLAQQPAATTNGLIQHQADWITGWLIGRYGFSDENNVLKSGYDLHQRRWPQWLKQHLPRHVQLPEVHIPGTPVGTAGKLLQSLDIPAEATVVAGTTDSTASFLATGVTDKTCGVTTLGSTLVIKQLSDHEIIDAARGIYSHRLGDRWLTGGASNSGGRVLGRFFTNEELARLSAQIDPDQESSLDYYPLPDQGERFPVSDPDKQPVLSPRPGQDHVFLHELLEGIARIEKDGYHALNLLGTAHIKEVVTAGGGAVNTAWSHIRQRVLECPVTLATQTEAAFGSALLAKEGCGLFERFN